MIHANIDTMETVVGLTLSSHLKRQFIWDITEYGNLRIRILLVLSLKYIYIFFFYHVYMYI